MSLPSTQEYEIEIKNRPSVYIDGREFDFKPSRKRPFTIYTHGSGQFAAVFRATDSTAKADYAIRFFIRDADKIKDRYAKISAYLKEKKLSWAVGCNFLDREFNINGTYQPMLLMEWVIGDSLIDFISKNISNKKALSNLQKSIFDLSESLEKNQIGHGDIQPGNIVVLDDMSLKLIDYDNMYVPGLSGYVSNEMGIQPFQHPMRTGQDFNSIIDRFSIWVIILNIEAFKVSPSLFSSAQEDLLFKYEDFEKPKFSNILGFLKKIGQDNNNSNLLRYLSVVLDSLNKTKYEDIPIPKSNVKTIKSALDSIESKDIQVADIQEFVEDIEYKLEIDSKNQKIIDKHIEENKENCFLITSDPDNMPIKDPLLRSVGKTPLTLNPKDYNHVYVINSNKREQVVFNDTDLNYYHCQFSALTKKSRTIGKAVTSKSKSATLSINIYYGDKVESSKKTSITIENSSAGRKRKYNGVSIVKEEYKIGSEIKVRVSCAGYVTRYVTYNIKGSQDKSRNITLTPKGVSSYSSTGRKKRSFFGRHKGKIAFLIFIIFIGFMIKLNKDSEEERRLEEQRNAQIAIDQRELLLSNWRSEIGNIKFDPSIVGSASSYDRYLAEISVFFKDYSEVDIVFHWKHSCESWRCSTYHDKDAMSEFITGDWSVDGDRRVKIKNLRDENGVPARREWDGATEFEGRLLYDNTLEIEFDFNQLLQEEQTFLFDKNY